MLRTTNVQILYDGTPVQKTHQLGTEFAFFSSMEHSTVRIPIVRATSSLLLTVVAFCLLVMPGCSSGPSGAPRAAITTKYAFWPLAPDEPRIQFLGSFNSSEDVSPTSSSGLEKIVFGAEAVRPAFVNKPYGVAIRDGKIFVCDIRAKALVIMDLVKKQTRLVGVSGTTRLERPVAVAVADDGLIYVADGIHSAILTYDQSERFVRSFTIPKLKPASLAVSADRLFVADMGRQQVLILDRNSGRELGAIGTVGDEEGQFRLPIGVSTDKSGNVYVADMMRCKVQKFSSAGVYVSSVGEQGDHAGGFARPKHLAVDPDGILYVVDSGFQNVQMFDRDFKLLMHFGSAGDFPGAMNLPVGVAVTDSGLEYFSERIHPGFAAKRLIVVANQFGDSKISVYALGDRKSNYSIADLAASAATVSAGVGTPSAADLKFQNIGGVEPGPDGTVPEPAPTPPADAAPATAPQPPKK